MERQDLKKGTRVRVTRKAEFKEKDWDAYWVDIMDKAVGQICTLYRDYRKEDTLGPYLDFVAEGEKIQLFFPMSILELVETDNTGVTESSDTKDKEEVIEKKYLRCIKDLKKPTHSNNSFVNERAYLVKKENEEYYWLVDEYGNTMSFTKEKESGEYFIEDHFNLDQK